MSQSRESERLRAYYFCLTLLSRTIAYARARRKRVHREYIHVAEVGVVSGHHLEASSMQQVSQVHARASNRAILFAHEQTAIDDVSPSVVVECGGIEYIVFDNEQPVGSE